MSVASKALKVVAPEAAAAGAAARHLKPGTAPADTKAELQRRRQEAAQRSQQRRAGTPDPAPAQDGDQAADQPAAAPPAAAPTSSSPAGSLFGPVSAGHAGGGFVLGLMTWAVARAYLTGGVAGVGQLFRAKFLNKTS